jgi:hypothetical protein
MAYTDASVLMHDGRAIDDFKRLNVKRVNIGLDSNDGVMLQGMKHMRDGDVNRRAVAILKRAAIQIHCSFVLGGPGETLQSLMETSRFIEELLAEPHVVTIEVSLLFPLPSAPAWDVFLGRLDSASGRALLAQSGRDPRAMDSLWSTTRAEFADRDDFDLDLASSLWADHFTHVGFAGLQAEKTRLDRLIASAGKVTGGFG